MDTIGAALADLAPYQVPLGFAAVILLGLVLRLRQARAHRNAPAKTAEAAKDKPALPAPDPAPAAQQDAPAAAPDLTAIGIYTPHFDFSDSDRFRQAIQDSRTAQAELAKSPGILLPSVDHPDAPESPLDKLAARAFVADADAAIAAVRWDTIEQMQTRLARTHNQIDANLAPQHRRLNPDFVALKLDELRLAHEHREKAKQERDLRQELSRIQKQEAQLARDLAKQEREEAQLQAQLTKAKAAVQRASGDQAFELEGKVGDLTRQIEQLHAQIARSQTMTRNTSAGHIFVLSNLGAFGEQVIKIGMTRRADPVEHITELARDSLPYPFDIHAIYYSETAEDLRDTLWQTFAPQRLNHAEQAHQGFFKVPLSHVADALARHAPEAEFVSSVEAQTYHEALARQRQEA